VKFWKRAVWIKTDHPPPPPSGSGRDAWERLASNQPTKQNMENIPPGFHLGVKEVHGSAAGEGAAVKSAAAVELGRRNAGRPKTVTPERREQLVKQAAVARAAKVVVAKPQAESPTENSAPASPAESPAEKTVLAPKIVVVKAKKEVIRR